MQTGSGQSLVTRALVISLLNRIKVCCQDAQCRCLLMPSVDAPSPVCCGVLAQARATHMLSCQLYSAYTTMKQICTAHIELTIRWKAKVTMMLLLLCQWQTFLAHRGLDSIGNSCVGLPARLLSICCRTFQSGRSVRCWSLQRTTDQLESRRCMTS